MGVDLQVVLAATVTAEEAFALPARLNSAPGVVAACRGYGRRQEWAWDEHERPIHSPSDILEAWEPSSPRSVTLSGAPGLLDLMRNQLQLSPLVRLSTFATDYGGCQLPIRQVCRALARELGTDRVLYVPDSGDWPSEIPDLYDVRFDDALARLAAWGPPVPVIGALGYAKALRLGFHYADGALRRADGSVVPDAEINPGYNRLHSGGVVTYHDGTLVPPEELARPDLRGGFAYYVDDFCDLAVAR